MIDKMRIHFIIFLFLLPLLSCKQQFPNNITAFEAIGDSVTIDTSAIQAAIDYVYVKGGGKVTVPPGVFIPSKSKQ